MTTNFMNYITIKHPEMKDSINLGAVVHCTCCGATMAAADACVDEHGRIYCVSCGKPVSIYEFAMAKLVETCELWGIPCIAEPINPYDGMIIHFPWKKNCDMICHEYSYGGDRGLFESAGFDEDCEDVRGYLTKAEAFETILHAWNKRER